MNYSNIKRELKKIYGEGIKAISKADDKYINFLLLSLDKLDNKLINILNLDTFGLYLIKKDIKKMKTFFIEQLKKKKIEVMAHEKKSRRNST